jgi:hypothetical protein
MMQKSTALTTIFLVKKCYFHYDMQKNKLGHLFKYVQCRKQYQRTSQSTTIEVE